MRNQKQHHPSVVTKNIKKKKKPFLAKWVTKWNMLPQSVNIIHTHRSAHKLAPDLGMITATPDMRLAAGRMSLLHPTATQTSPTPKDFR